MKKILIIILSLAIFCQSIQADRVGDTSITNTAPHDEYKEFTLTMATAFVLGLVFGLPISGGLNVMWARDLLTLQNTIREEKTIRYLMEAESLGKDITRVINSAEVGSLEWEENLAFRFSVLNNKIIGTKEKERQLLFLSMKIGSERVIEPVLIPLDENVSYIYRMPYYFGTANYNSKILEFSDIRMLLEDANTQQLQGIKPLYANAGNRIKPRISYNLHQQMMQQVPSAVEELTNRNEEEKIERNVYSRWMVFKSYFDIDELVAREVPISGYSESNWQLAEFIKSFPFETNEQKDLMSYFLFHLRNINFLSNERTTRSEMNVLREKLLKNYEKVRQTLRYSVRGQEELLIYKVSGNEISNNWQCTWVPQKISKLGAEEVGKYIFNDLLDENMMALQQDVRCFKMEIMLQNDWSDTNIIEFIRNNNILSNDNLFTSHLLR